jgi:hypothetical protein
MGLLASWDLLGQKDEEFPWATLKEAYLVSQQMPWRFINVIFGDGFKVGLINLILQWSRWLFAMEEGTRLHQPAGFPSLLCLWITGPTNERLTQHRSNLGEKIQQS